MTSVYMFVNYTVLCSFTKRKDNRSGGLDLDCPNSGNRLQCLLPAIRPSNSTLSHSHDISHGENGHIHLLRAVMENHNWTVIRSWLVAGPFGGTGPTGQRFNAVSTQSAVTGVLVILPPTI